VDELRRRALSIIREYSYLGEVTDVWLSPELMSVLDPRPALERIAQPFKLGSVWVSAGSELSGDEVRVAFKTYLLL
jgi:hypothetical protein